MGDQQDKEQEDADTKDLFDRLMRLRAVTDNLNNRILQVIREEEAGEDSEFPHTPSISGSTATHVRGHTSELSRSASMSFSSKD